MALAGLALGSACAIAASFAPSGAALRVEPDARRLDLTPHVELLEDPGGALELEDVLGARARFEPAGVEIPNFGYTDATYWFRVELALPRGTAGRWLLELDFPTLDHVTAYVRGPGGLLDVTETGDRHPFETRAIDAPTFLFPLRRELGPRLEVFVRVRSSGTVIVPLQLWRDDALASALSKRQLGWGSYYAFLLGLACYNLFLFFVVRDRSYLYYVCYIVFLVAFQAALSGHTFQYLWPNWPVFGSGSAVAFLLCTLSASYLFMRRMCNVVEMAPRLHRPIGIAAAGFAALLPLVWINYGVAARLATVIAVLAVGFMPVPILMSYLRGYRPARYLVAGIVLILPGAVVLALRQLGVLPEHFLTEHAVQFGTAAEALVLSFALADRIDLLQRAESEAQSRLLAAEHRALEAQRDLSRRLIGAQDAERKRIAAELHDGLGQNMSVIVNQLSRLVGGRAPRDAEPTVALAKQTVGELRAVAHDLHPHKLDRLGLSAALESTVEEALTASGIAGECHASDVDDLLEPGAQLHVYRIVQEAVANAVKHASPSEVSVRVRLNGDTLEVRVEDDGRGMPEVQASGLGIAGILERARLLGGEARFDSRPGEGVRVEVDVPLEGIRTK